MQLFQDVPFDDREAFDDFTLALSVNHRHIAAIMFPAGKVYEVYPLNVRFEHAKDWQQNLQQELQSIFTLNGLTGLPDLSGADLRNEEEFDDFMDQLIFVEAKINLFLGIQ